MNEPLCPTKKGAEQLVLTPAHFLNANLGHFKIDLTRPTTDGSAASRKLITLWKLNTQYLKKLWLEWKQSYLTFLRDRVPKSLKTEYRTTKYKPSIGDMVLVVDFNTAPGIYKFAEIVDLPMSSDNKIRHAGIKFPNGYKSTRPLKFLAPLELKRMTQREEPLNPC